ncbi:MAG: energy transducer TonB [Candidatus Aminicenantes bacterium]
MNKAAADAVRQWVYKPYVIDGKPRGVIFNVTLRFRLN